MADLTEEQLKQIIPKCKAPNQWISALNAAMERFEINSPHRTSAFLAQVAHESAELNRVVENLSYSALGLTKT